MVTWDCRLDGVSAGRASGHPGRPPGPRQPLQGTRDPPQGTWTPPPAAACPYLSILASAFLDPPLQGIWTACFQVTWTPPGQDFMGHLDFSGHLDAPPGLRRGPSIWASWHLYLDPPTPGDFRPRVTWTPLPSWTPPRASGRPSGAPGRPQGTWTPPPAPIRHLGILASWHLDLRGRREPQSLHAPQGTWTPSGRGRPPGHLDSLQGTLDAAICLGMLAVCLRASQAALQVTWTPLRAPGPLPGAWTPPRALDATPGTWTPSGASGRPLGHLDLHVLCLCNRAYSANPRRVPTFCSRSYNKPCESDSLATRASTATAQPGSPAGAK
jgi:hypothetical protein